MPFYTVIPTAVSTMTRTAIETGAEPDQMGRRSAPDNGCDSKVAIHCVLSDCPGLAEALRSGGQGFLPRWESGRLACRAASI
jgi:hypothetical protein